MLFQCKRFFLLLVVSFVFSNKNAFPTTPVKKISDFEDPKPTQIVRVPRQNVHVLVADYPLIKKDFPFLRHLSKKEINDWLRKRVVVSKTQAEQQKVNTWIPHEDAPKKITAFRPKDFGRALILNVQEEGKNYLINEKGAGAAQPEFGQNGLLSATESLREFFMEKLVRHALLDSHPKATFDTEGIYAAFQIDSAIHTGWGETTPMGMVFRQAIRRNHTPFALWDSETSREVELALRPFGLTSAGAHRYLGRPDGSHADRSMDLINVQGGTDANGLKIIADWGAFLVVKDGDFYKSGYPIGEWLDQGEPEFPSESMKRIIDPAHDHTVIRSDRFPFEIFGYKDWQRPDPTNDEMVARFAAFVHEYEGEDPSAAESAQVLKLLLDSDRWDMKKPCSMLFSDSK